MRLLKHRNNLKNYNNISDTKDIQKLIEEENKENEISLVVIVLGETKHFSKEFETYLLNLNKKILLISELDFKFNSIFIYRTNRLSNNNLFYINNDIQFGSRYIF